MGIIRPRHGIKSLWDTYKNRVYAQGEMLVESPESGVGTGHVNVKFGDGVTNYENLPYAIEAPISECVEGSEKPLTSGAGYNLEKQIEVERARINNLSTLEEGSTTGDAELIDIRTGANGTVYESAGEAVRGQITELGNEMDTRVTDVENDLESQITGVKSDLSELDERYTHGKNYFNFATATMGYSVASGTGELVKLDNCGVSDYIEVETDTTYAFTEKHTIAFYDDNKLFISGIPSTNTDVVFATPSNCKYLRFSFKTNDLENYNYTAIQMEKGEVRTAFEEYKVSLKQEYIKVGKDSLDIFVAGKNLFNKNGNFIENCVVQSSNGSIAVIDGYSISDYIEVQPNETYVVNSRRTIAFYGENFTFISGIGTSIESNVFTAPDDCKYVRISFATSEKDTLQLEMGETSTEYEAFETHKHIKAEYIDNSTIEAFMDDLIIVGNLLSNDVKIKEEYSVRPTDGTLVPISGSSYCVTEDYIKVKANTQYTFKLRHTLAWYNSDKEYISGIASSDTTLTVTSPSNAKYIRFSWNRSHSSENLVSEGTKLTPGEKPKIKEDYLNNKYTCRITSVKNIGSIDSDGKNLCLVSVKQIYTNGKIPDVVGYLYLDIYENKLYYSATLPDNPVYLCDWNTDVAYSACGDNELSKPKYWHFSITKDGDIICLLNYYRAKPIIYPHTDYANPVCVDGLEVNPYGLLTNQSIVQMDDGTFYFGEYALHSLSEEESNGRRNIWKVVQPYTNSENWSIEHSFKHVYYKSSVSDEPDNEIGHVHSVTFDFYNNTLYANTGDIGRHVRIWRKKLSDGVWEEVARGVGDDQSTENSQKFRIVNLVFTEGACWWATDSFNVLHNLYKADRNSDGDIDFSTTKKIINLERFDGRDKNNQQPTYCNVLLREPNGILFIDRAEDRTDHKLDIVFYSFDTEQAYICKTLKKVDFSNGLYNMGDKASLVDRLGLPNQCMISYQPFSTDYIMVGGADYIRMNQVDIFNNNPDNYVGALKIKIEEV